MILIIGFLLLAAALLAIVAFRISGWCLNRRLSFLVYLALAVLGLGTLYGLLRLTGVLVFPGDHTWSVDFFNASWRDEGVGFLMIFGAPFSGVLAALLSRRKQDGGSSGAQIEEKT